MLYNAKVAKVLEMWNDGSSKSFAGIAKADAELIGKLTGKREKGLSTFFLQ